MTDKAAQTLDLTTASFLILFNIADAVLVAGQAVREIIVASGDPIDNYLSTWEVGSGGHCSPNDFPERSVHHIHHKSAKRGRLTVLNDLQKN